MTYAGDISPTDTFAALQADPQAVLVDVAAQDAASPDDRAEAGVHGPDRAALAADSASSTPPR